MTIDLSAALHDLVDGHHPDGPPPVDVPRVRSRARRRRAVHVGAVGAVGVGTAGAVAFGAMYVTGTRDASIVLPADPSTAPGDAATLDSPVILPSDPSAAPGECGSNIAPLLGTPDPTLGMRASVWSDPSAQSRERSVPQPRPLGAFASSRVHLDVVSSLPEDGAGPPSTELSSMQDTLAMVEQAYSDRLAERDAGEAVKQSVLDDLAGAVESLRTSVEQRLAAGEESAPPTALARVRVLVTHDDRVVATATLPRERQSNADAAWDRTPSGLLRETVILDLVTCTIDGVGGELLPTGTYGALVVRDGEPLTGLTGPWTIVVPPQVAVSGLPGDFPTDVVPMPPGRLLSVSGDAATGWEVQISVEGLDRLNAAAALLTDVDGAEEEALDPLGATVIVPGWSVHVVPASADGQMTLSYRVTPD
ncbi:hypothetical protein Q760_07840 [Cellulomonas cellasea DSM 20118]|uniref:Uncharacterized protein n=2 Tax=Cellulomonas cellasea TaxID=43670 RepID=A0A0A0BEY7_9CELL|nr:hypothetical protein [Cellulomonas cellasea]KGM03896.1 hypothetical protein Q760_07840 [Cellulomonas cellasea DSM 20118]GEA87329.1 hypothetical protein CCE01nite_12780 [Cellulomonas cellasea]